MARVLLLHQYFPPDAVITGRHGQMIASALARRGHEVSAIVAQPSYHHDSPAAPTRERYEEIDVHRISMGPFRGRRSRTVRFAGYLTYLLGATIAALRESPDVVLTFHIPPFLPGVALVVARLHGAKIVYVPQDIHPDILLESGWLTLPAPAAWAWTRFNRLVLSRADRIVALGEGMRETLIAKGADPGRTRVIPAWPDPAFPVLERDDAWRREYGVSPDDLVALYAGNMGLMHPLDALIRTAASVHGQGVRVIIAGYGERRRHWEREVERLGVGHVLMLPFQTDHDFRRLVSAADVSVVSLQPGMERLAVPSRPYAFLAAGRPVIALSSPNADIARDVITSGAGWHAADAAELTALLLRLAGDRRAVAEAASNARRLYEAGHQPEQAISRYADLVEDLLV